LGHTARQRYDTTAIRTTTTARAIPIRELISSIEGLLVEAAVVSDGVGSIDEEEVLVTKEEAVYELDGVFVIPDDECNDALGLVPRVLWVTLSVTFVSDDWVSALVFTVRVLWAARPVSLSSDD
jgi:hypothetical protein